MRTLIIDGTKLLDWIAEHKQVWEDMLKRFNPDDKDYTRVMVTTSEYYPIGEDEWNY